MWNAYNEQMEKESLLLLLEDNSLISEMPFIESDFFTSKYNEWFKIIDSYLSLENKIDLVVFIKLCNDKNIQVKASEFMFDSIGSRIQACQYFNQLRALNIKRRTLSIISEKEKPYEEIISDLEWLKNIDKVSIEEEESLLESLMTNIEKEREHPSALSTWFVKLDSVVKMRKGHLVTLAARSSIGKSALAMNLWVNMARSGSEVLFFSLEMDKVEYMSRIMWSLSWTPSDVWQDWSIRNDVMNKTFDQFTEFQDNIRIDYSSNISSWYIMKYAKSYWKADVIIIDYLQLLCDEEKRWELRASMLGRITRNLKALARELWCVVILLSQVNRESVKSAEGMPDLHHLRESGNIEQDSDIVLIINRKERNSTEWILRVAKQRQWKTWDIEVSYVPYTCTFSEKITY